MAPRHKFIRGNYHEYSGVRPRSDGRFAAEMCAGGTRIPLGQFGTAWEAARAWDLAMWRLGKQGPLLNFLDAPNIETAATLAPSPTDLTAAQRRRYDKAQRRLAIAAEDEAALNNWKLQCPDEYMARRNLCFDRDGGLDSVEKDFFQRRKAMRTTALSLRRQRKRNAEAFMNSPEGRKVKGTDPIWDDLFADTSDESVSESEDF